MVAVAGGADHCAGTISCGEPGVACGARLFDTMSKIPAAEIAIKRAVEGCLQHRRLRIAAHGFEVGRRQSNPLIAQIGSRVHPVLSG